MTFSPVPAGIPSDHVSCTIRRCSCPAATESFTTAQGASAGKMRTEHMKQKAPIWNGEYPDNRGYKRRFAANGTAPRLRCGTNQWFPGGNAALQLRFLRLSMTELQRQIAAFANSFQNCFGMFYHHIGNAWGGKNTNFHVGFSFGGQFPNGKRNCFSGPVPFIKGTVQNIKVVGKFIVYAAPGNFSVDFERPVPHPHLRR